VDVLNYRESKDFLRVVAKITRRIRELQQPLLYTTGSDQHLLTRSAFQGLCGGRCCSGILRHISSFLYFFGNSTIMMTIDTSHDREVAVFDILHRRQTTVLLCDALVSWSPNEN
jgi:hypothetical protein